MFLLPTTVQTVCQTGNYGASILSTPSPKPGVTIFKSHFLTQQHNTRVLLESQETWILFFFILST